MFNILPGQGLGYVASREIALGLGSTSEEIEYVLRYMHIFTGTAVQSAFEFDTDQT